jgi:predicted nuclease of predicted toxin-antitoxin system
LRFKLDENLGKSIKKLFPDSSYDVQSVQDENMLGTKDEVIFETCQKEKRCLITLDLDFSNVLKFPLNNLINIDDS